MNDSKRFKIVATAGLAVTFRLNDQSNSVDGVPFVEAATEQEQIEALNQAKDSPEMFEILSAFREAVDKIRFSFPNITAQMTPFNGYEPMREI